MVFLNNKKGNIFSLWFMVVVFNVFIAAAFTFLIGFNNLAITEIIDPIYNTTKEIAENRTSAAIQTHIDTAYNEAISTTIPWDIVIFGLIINFYFALIKGAIVSRKLNAWAVLSILTFGSIFLLFLISISIDVQQWILKELYTEALEDLSVDTPIMDWFFNNIGMISFFMAIILVILNQFDKLKTLLIGGDRE